MELRQYWNLLRRWLWLVVLGVILAGGTSFLVSRDMTPVYQTGVTLLVTPGSTQALDNYTSLIASERLAQTYAQLLGSAPILQETYRQLGFPVQTEAVTATQTVQRFSGFGVSAEPVRDTQLISVRVTGTDPALITRAANTVAQVFIDWQNGIQQSRYTESKTNLTAEMEKVQANIQETEAALRDLQAQGDAADPNELNRLQDVLARYRNSYSALLNSYSSIGLAEASSADTVTVVSPAVQPFAPIRPRVMQNTLLAAVVGGMLAVGVAFLVEYLDDTVKDPGDLQLADLNAVAAVQHVSLNGKGSTQALFAVHEPKSLVSEAYRTLRTNLQFSSPDRPVHSLVVTSALATEGKTTTAANLAVVMAQAGKGVVLVDADLRRPALHKIFGLANREGLTTALVQDMSSLDACLQATEVDNLRVLASGPIPPNPQELLGSQRMRDLLHSLQAQADVVIVDTPPSLVVSDANVLASLADGVLLVVNTGQTRRATVQQAAEALRQVGAHLVGGVLNQVDTRGGRNYYYYYYYSHYYSDQEREDGRGLVARLRRLGRRLGLQRSHSRRH
jgi:succinoglycan biosynthesis transport protein ExoP